MAVMSPDLRAPLALMPSNSSNHPFLFISFVTPNGFMFTSIEFTNFYFCNEKVSGRCYDGEQSNTPPIPSFVSRKQEVYLGRVGKYVLCMFRKISGDSFRAVEVEDSAQQLLPAGASS